MLPFSQKDIQLPFLLKSERTTVPSCWLGVKLRYTPDYLIPRSTIAPPHPSIWYTYYPRCFCSTVSRASLRFERSTASVDCIEWELQRYTYLIAYPILSYPTSYILKHTPVLQYIRTYLAIYPWSMSAFCCTISPRSHLTSKYKFFPDRYHFSSQTHSNFRDPRPPAVPFLVWLPPGIKVLVIPFLLAGYIVSAFPLHRKALRSGTGILFFTSYFFILTFTKILYYFLRFCTSCSCVRF